ncbi:MAG TPA: sigma-70 family RNA polymerase sigma factor [Pirellulaceae bacterium]|jgi:RNA polymerase sigma-70 factor (ECF subfamily)
MLPVSAPLATRFIANLQQVPDTSRLPEPTDNQLIAAAKRGDAAAYGALVSKYQVRLCSSLWHVCGSREVAEDTAQEAFLRAYLKLGNYTGASAFYTWLYRIAVNLIISDHRKRKTQTCTEQNRMLCDQSQGDNSERPDDSLLRQERVKQVQQALNNLSSEHRTILVLREMESCDYDEIASLLNVPIGTVRSRLHRARLELRQRLAVMEAEVTSERQ